MAIIKCKMCGGDLEIVPEVTVAECEYCGTKQTVPTVDNEKKVTLFSRANRLRFGCEFDKAAGVYESIVAEFHEEAEAYWGLVLCKYGIEYVDDPATARKIPTCHRSSFDSVMDDSNFELVMEYSDAASRRVYRNEAKTIEELRKGIIEISGKEEPYDIFICYKETDETGGRTLDSVIAQDIYDALTEKGYRVFFSRITLEDKLGQEYEPYIFAALHSAKIMLAVGTDYEYYNAVWVKNEWSRFLQLIASGEKKTLIPCFKNLDAYDMPKEFARLQAQDMGKVGAMQDLLRGIEKIIGGKTEATDQAVAQPVVVQQASANNIQAMLDRGNLALEDGEWDSASNYFEEVLNQDAKSAEAYLGKALVAAQHATLEDIVQNTCTRILDNKDYKKAKRFSGEQLRTELESFELKLKEELERIEQIQREEQERVRKKKEEESQARNTIIKKYHNIALSAGGRHTVGLRYDGTVVAMGRNEEGQCETTLWTDVIAVSANIDHTLGLKADGSVVATRYIGDDKYNYGQCDVAKWRDIVAISAGPRFSVGLKKDGTVIATGYNDNGQCNVGEWTDIIAVSAGSHHTVGLKSDGTVVATDYYGSHYDAECDVENWRDIVAISAGYKITVGLKSDGSVVLTGTLFRSWEVERWKNIVAISAGHNRIVGIREDGVIMDTEQSKSDNEMFQTDPACFSELLAVSAADLYAVGLKADGTVVTTDYLGGENDYENQCALWDWKLFYLPEEKDLRRAYEKDAFQKRTALEDDNCVKQEKVSMMKAARERIAPVQGVLSVGSGHGVAGVRIDGTVIIRGLEYKSMTDPVMPSDQWNNIVSVSVGSEHVVGLKSDGTVVACGENERNQCNVFAWRDIVAIAAGSQYTVGLRADGTTVMTDWPWHVSRGYYNDVTKTYCDHLSYVVNAWKNIVTIGVSGMITWGVKANGRILYVKMSRKPSYDEYKRDASKQIVALSCYGANTMFLYSDGTVSADVTGRSNYEYFINKWSDIVAVKTYGNNYFGLRSDGTVVACGENKHGECDVSDWQDIVAIDATWKHTIGLKSDGTIVFTEDTTEAPDSLINYSHRMINNIKALDGKLFSNVETVEQEREASRLRQEQERLKSSRREDGLCQHCGGTFKGLFGKKCTSCGKPKDY